MGAELNQKLLSATDNLRSKIDFGACPPLEVRRGQTFLWFSSYSSSPKKTSETVIALQILNLNLSKVLRDLPSFLIFILVAKIRDYFTDLQSTNNDEWVIQ